MQKIVPHLWFDNQAKEAADFYVSSFGRNSQVTNSITLTNTPSGDTDVVSFNIAGFEFMAISAGPLFKPNPSISFMINFDPSREKNAREQLDALWEKLADGGEVAMPLDEYPFSKRYGWIQDKYGVSWQLILTDPEGEERPFVVPSLMYVTDSGEVAQEATDFYLSVFKNSKRGQIARYPAGLEFSKEGAIMFTDFKLEGQWFTAMDAMSAQHPFAFNEAVSLIVSCDTQEEIDYYWEKLSVVPEAEQCGWLKDKYGVSWQIVPTLMYEMMESASPEQLERVTQAFLQMKKFDIEKLKQAYED